MNAEDKFLAYQMFFDLMNNNDDNTEDDKTFRKNTKEQITNRDAQYTELLSHFVSLTKVRNVLKEFFKWCFYLVVICSIITLIIIVSSLFKKYISSANIEQITEAIPLLMTAMVGFVSAIITIPVTITKYLFSTEEDKNITDIILHTQKHDTGGRKWAMDFKEIAENLKKQNKSTINNDTTNNIKNQGL